MSTNKSVLLVCGLIAVITLLISSCQPETETIIETRLVYEGVSVEVTRLVEVAGPPVEVTRLVGEGEVVEVVVTRVVEGEPVEVTRIVEGEVVTETVIEEVPVETEVTREIEVTRIVEVGQPPAPPSGGSSNDVPGTRDLRDVPRPPNSHITVWEIGGSGGSWSETEITYFVEGFTPQQVAEYYVGVMPDHGWQLVAVSGYTQTYDMTDVNHGLYGVRIEIESNGVVRVLATGPASLDWYAYLVP